MIIAINKIDKPGADVVNYTYFLIDRHFIFSQGKHMAYEGHPINRVISYNGRVCTI